MKIFDPSEAALNGIKEGFRDVLRQHLMEIARQEVEKVVDDVSQRVDVAFYKDVTTNPERHFLQWLISDNIRRKQP